MYMQKNKKLHTALAKKIALYRYAHSNAVLLAHGFIPLAPNVWFHDSVPVNMTRMEAIRVMKIRKKSFLFM
jgi:hypothetical protein